LPYIDGATTISRVDVLKYLLFIFPAARIAPRFANDGESGKHSGAQMNTRTSIAHLAIFSITTFLASTVHATTLNDIVGAYDDGRLFSATLIGAGLFALIVMRRRNV